MPNWFRVDCSLPVMNMAMAELSQQLLTGPCHLETALRPSMLQQRLQHGWPRNKAQTHEIAGVFNSLEILQY